MTTETSNARGEVVAWFPTNAQGEIIRNYGDGSPVYACRTKEEAEQAKRCHLGATGPVIPLYAAPPPAAAQQQGQAVALDRMAIRLLVAAGFVTEDKANEALSIAHGFDKGPLTPPSAPVGVEGGILERLDAIHRQVFGKPYPTDALAQQPAAVDEAMVERGLAEYRRMGFVYDERQGIRNILTAALTAALAAPCCMCGNPVDTRENGTPGAELTDGRWTCSHECFDKATNQPQEGKSNA